MLIRLKALKGLLDLVAALNVKPSVDPPLKTKAKTQNQ